MKSINLLVVSAFLLCLVSCIDDDVNPSNTTNLDNFDRQAMLTFWADEIIIPAYESYASHLTNLQSATNAFIAAPSETNYDAVTTNYLAAYKAWQRVSMFEIGKAESIGLRNFTNIFPTDIEKINSNISSGDYNLELPSNFVAQGFPALDYLLYGTGTDKTEILLTLSNPAHLDYVNTLVNRLSELTNEVINDWKIAYRDEFVANSGSSATASVDKLVNDVIFYYEKYLRAGKIGIPAGVFSGNPISTSVEAAFSGDYSLELFNEALDAVQGFFNGQSFINPGTSGESLASYLSYLYSITESENILDDINNQWELARSAAQELAPNFKEQIETDHLKMLATYDELQKVVILLKVDMLQQLNIQVDYVDADGD